MEPLTAGSIVAVCDCCPALQPLTAAAAISAHNAAAAGPRDTDEFTMLSDLLEMAGPTVDYPCHTLILRCPKQSGVVHAVRKIASGLLRGLSCCPDTRRQQRPQSLLARTSNLLIAGGEANSSSALSARAFPTGPPRCASRAASSGKRR